MRQLLVVILCVLSLSFVGCGLGGGSEVTAATKEFLGTLKTEIDAMGVIVAQEFVKTTEAGFLIVIRDKASGSIICSTRINSLESSGVLTQLIPFTRVPGVKYQVQVSLGSVVTPWTDV